MARNGPQKPSIELNLVAANSAPPRPEDATAAALRVFHRACS